MPLDSQMLAIAKKHYEAWLDDPASSETVLSSMENAIAECIELRDKHWQAGNETLRHERDKAKADLADAHYAAQGFRQKAELAFACRDVIDMQDEYIAYLGEAEKMTSGYLHAHNWTYPPEFIARGDMFRSVIAELKAKASQSGREGEAK